jgi:hypothetical protein
MQSPRDAALTFAAYRHLDPSVLSFIYGGSDASLAPPEPARPYSDPTWGRYLWNNSLAFSLGCANRFPLILYKDRSGSVVKLFGFSEDFDFDSVGEVAGTAKRPNPGIVEQSMLMYERHRKTVEVVALTHRTRGANFRLYPSVKAPSVFSKSAGDPCGIVLEVYAEVLVSGERWLVIDNGTITPKVLDFDAHVLYYAKRSDFTTVRGRSLVIS